jgi:hypothetical protein
MGHELWTSPITGYRRKGTRLSELRSVLGAKIAAHAILEPIQCCPENALATEMRDLLGQRSFDVAGVMNDPTGPVIGFVVAKELSEGTVGDHKKPLNAEHLISDATPVADLLKVLRAKERAFVLVGPEVKGIVTLADLNKPPIRVYLFGLLSLLEMHLRFWVRHIYGDGSWKERLNAKRLEYANKIQAERQKRNQQIDLLDCLQFCDLRDLLLGNEELRNRLNIESKGKGEELLGEAEKLRDKLAHSQQDLVEGTSWQDLIGLVDQMEALVHRSDDAVEHEAKSSKKDGPSLWTVS